MVSSEPDQDIRLCVSLARSTAPAGFLVEVSGGIILDTVRAYADHVSPRDAAYVDELRDVASRAAAVPVLVAVDPEGRVLGGVAYVPGPGTPLSEGAGEGEASFRMLAVDPSVAGRGIVRAA